MNCEKRIKSIAKNWFFNNPLLFSTFCTHSLVENAALTVPMRTGRRLIEFSSAIVENYSDFQLETCLKIQIYKILLQHPYKRQPHNPKPGIMSIASDVTVYNLIDDIKEKLAATEFLPGILYLKNQAIRFHILEHPLGIKWHNSEEEKFFQRNLQVDHNNGLLLSVDDLSYEQWYGKILFLVKETAVSGENAGSLEDAEALGVGAELWEENQEAIEEIKDQLKKAEIDQGWGETGGGLQRKLKDECDFSFDYRRALAQFRQSIVSPARKLTRMRPSRRYGFKAMGSRYERKANILIAVDVSGSITDESFERFYHAINNFFFLGIIEKIDLIFFDVNLKNTKPITFQKKINLQEIKGRGGTNFQPAIDFYLLNRNLYSGMIIFTDGEGNPPLVDGGSANILWILDSRLAFEKSRQWINSINGCKSTYLPF